MSRTILILIFFSFLSLKSVTAQDNYVAGYVVTLQGDTLMGTINNERWLNSPKSIQYKNAQGIVFKYEPKDIKGFLIENKFAYLSENTRYDSTSNKVDELPNTPQPAFKNEVLFLRIIVLSRLSLLAYETPGRTHLFIKGEDGRVEELINHRFRTSGEIRENMGYITQLKTYLNDCPKVTVSSNSPYSNDFISKLIVKYNECRQRQSQVFDTKEKTIVRPGLVLAVAYDQYRPSFEGGMGYGAGGFVNLVFPNKNYGRSLYSELAYRKTADQLSRKTDEVYKVQSIQWSTIFRFRIIPQLKGLLVGGGVSFSGGLPDEYRRTTNQNISATDAHLNTAILGDICYMASQNIMIGLRFESGDSISMNDNYFGNMDTWRSTSFRFSLGWQF